ncbi:MAG: cell division protein SepF [Negativicutes bacterium]|nr:cell division protein SepF [Negativicutes bacterium]
MAIGLIDKLTNFLMPVEDAALPEMSTPGDRRASLKVHSPAALKVYIATPQTFDDVRVCADCLKANVAVLINFEDIDSADTQQRIGDFLNGVCFVSGGTNQRVSDHVILYVPANVDVNKEPYAYSIPTYSKHK